MGRSNAERQAAYRARKLEKGEKYNNGTRGKSKKNTSKWEIAEFIALDGEGENIGELQKFIVGEGRKHKIYFAKEHSYTLLADSAGGAYFNGGRRLDSMGCIDFLLDMSDQHPKAICVIFAGSYDINHMFMYGFKRDQLQKIARGETLAFKKDGVEYRIEYRARKSLTMRRGLYTKINSAGKKKLCWKSSVVIWDVWGFFQDSFIGVVGKWLGKDHKHYQLIKDMKAKRGNFADIAQDKINAYNAAELECLVEVMSKVRDAIDKLGLQCKRWDGAGAVAAALMQKHNIKEFKQDTPEDIMYAVQCAYAGGRIEVCKIGTHNGPVYDYDVNSAYPSVMVDLPCMAHGEWITGMDEPVPSGFTLVHCSYEFAENLRFYPFFYRTDKMQISYPQRGEGWYWYPEYEAAQACPGIIDVIEWVHWKPHCTHKPFKWIPDYYKTRQQWVKNPTEEWHKGAEKIIKLGLNSLYGKSAQQLGGRDDKAPVYHQLEWAGYITSTTRARLYSAAILDADSIIGFATDGIFSTRTLPIALSSAKDMGAWELKEPIPQGMIIAMAGVYWWIMKENEYQHFSRGFDKDSMKTPDLVLQAWKDGKDGIDIPMHRLIGMGSACASDTLWEMRGRFTEGMRTLRLDGKSHKRIAINVATSRPHKKLVDLQPAPNFEYDEGLQKTSHPYPLKWLEINDDDIDYDKALELIKENGDTENI